MYSLYYFESWISYLKSCYLLAYNVILILWYRMYKLNYVVGQEAADTHCAKLCHMSICRRRIDHWMCLEFDSDHAVTFRLSL